MCGVFALVDWSGARPSHKAWAAQARERLYARGPDHQAAFASPGGECLLVHTRLSILDPTPAADQPMVHGPTGVAIVFNGEIYNYPELRRSLAEKGADFASHGDTEVILQTYLQDGLEGLARLRGMYAFAIWDPRERSLTVARDPFGIKPLYIWSEDGAIAVSSQIRALACGLNAVQWDDAVLLQYAMFGHAPGLETPVAGIRAVEPGSITQFHAGGAVRRGPSSALLDLFAPAPAAGGARSEIVEAVEESVSAHTLADVPIGLLLSAGLDSAAIASRLAKVADPSQIQAFTIGFSDLGLDERPQAGAIAAKLGFKSTAEPVTNSNLHDQMGAYFDAMDCPSVDAINIYFAAKLVRQNGLKLALTGVGGDELLGGYPSFRRVPFLTSSGGRALLALSGLVRGPGRLKLPFNAEKLQWMRRSGRTLAGAYLVQRGLRDPLRVAAAYGCEEAESRRIFEAAHGRLHSEIAGMADAWSAVSYLETRFYLIPRLLRDADWAGMAHSVELRTPLVDWPLWRRLRPLLDSPAARAGGSKRRLLGPALAPGVNALTSGRKLSFSNPYRALARLAGAAPSEGVSPDQAWADFVLDRWKRSL